MTAVASAMPRATGGRLPAVPLFALGIALLLSFAWATKDWPALVQLRLPDSDDMMRLQQVRDWLAGQPFGDLRQHRLGLPPDGASMHWSRLADLVPAALIVALTPWLGTPGAELAMVIAWPAMLFLAYLLLVAAIAARLGGEGARIPALILAALAWPTTSLFIPGRIDHHAMQIVLCLVAVLALLRPATLRSGAIAGVAAAVSLAIGLETAPEVAAVMTAMALLWVLGSDAETRRALGFGAGLGLTTLVLLALLRPADWPEQWCDGFTPPAVRATLVGAAAWAAIGLAGLRLAAPGKRLLTLAAVGAASVALLTRTSTVCLAGPYAPLDPFLAKVFIANVGEARPLFGQDSPGTMLACGGLVLCGAALGTWQAYRDRSATALAFAIVLVLGALASVAQVRVTYVMAGLGAVPFAVALGRSRQGLGPRLLLWVVGAGTSWTIAAAQIDAAVAAPVTAAHAARRGCASAEPIRRLNALKPGTFAAPLDLGAYIIGMTPHRALAAVYHRNVGGNLAMYEFFLSPPERSEQLARQWGIDYVALCPDSLEEHGLETLRHDSLVEELQSGKAPPPWMQPVPSDGALMVYRVR